MPLNVRIELQKLFALFYSYLLTLVGSPEGSIWQFRQNEDQRGIAVRKIIQNVQRTLAKA